MTTQLANTARRNNDELLSRARGVMPGGVLATYAMADDVAFVAERGQGSTIYDADGRGYIDYVLGSGPMILGHRHPRVVAALDSQLSRGTQFYTLTPQAIELAEFLIDTIPCAERVKFVSSGAEATFEALRVARAATGRTKVMKFAGAYHGHHDYAMIRSTIATAGIPEAIDSTVITAPFNDAETAAQLIYSQADDLAAVIVEPVQRSTSPRTEFLNALREATIRTGSVLIFDEMVTGFRVGLGGAQERFGITSDLGTYGKAIGGGLPLAAVVGRADLMDVMNPRRAREADYVYCSGTLSGNPFGATAGLATLQQLAEPGVFDRLDSRSDLLRSNLADVAASADIPIQIVGEGAMVGVLFAEGDPLDPATAQASNQRQRAAAEKSLIRQGIFINIASKFYMSTEHTEDQLSYTTEAFGVAIKEAAQTS